MLEHSCCASNFDRSAGVLQQPGSRFATSRCSSTACTRTRNAHAPPPPPPPAKTSAAHGARASSRASGASSCDKWPLPGIIARRALMVAARRPTLTGVDSLRAGARCACQTVGSDAVTRQAPVGAWSVCKPGAAWSIYQLVGALCVFHHVDFLVAALGAPAVARQARGKQQAASTAVHAPVVRARGSERRQPPQRPQISADRAPRQALSAERRRQQRAVPVFDAQRAAVQV